MSSSLRFRACVFLIGIFAISVVLCSRVKVVAKCKYSYLKNDVQPRLNFTVKLMERDQSSSWMEWADSDDMLNMTVARINEEFELTGAQFEFGGIEPYLLFELTCNGTEKTEQIALYKMPNNTSVEHGVTIYDLKGDGKCVIFTDKEGKCNEEKAVPKIANLQSTKQNSKPMHHIYIKNDN